MSLNRNENIKDYVNDNLNFYFWNANAISNKLDEINDFLKEHNVDILAISETKLNKTKEEDIKFENYNIIFNSRNSHGGGVLLIIKN